MALGRYPALSSLNFWHRRTRRMASAQCRLRLHPQGRAQGLFPGVCRGKGVPWRDSFMSRPLRFPALRNKKNLVEFHGENCSTIVPRQTINGTVDLKVYPFWDNYLPSHWVNNGFCGFSFPGLVLIPGPDCASALARRYARWRSNPNSQCPAPTWAAICPLLLGSMRGLPWGRARRNTRASSPGPILI